MLFSSLVVALVSATALGQNVSEVNAEEPFGFQSTISPVMLNAFNPLVLNVMKKIVENLELPMPDQIYKVPKLGSLDVHFDKTRCHGLILASDPGFSQGMYFADGYIGFRLAFDVACRSNFSTNVKYEIGYDPNSPLAQFLRFAPHGWANLTLQGTKADSLLHFKYAPESRALVPVLEKLDLTFTSVDVIIRDYCSANAILTSNLQIQMDDHPLANFVTKTFKKLLPPITSMVFKRAIRLMVPGLVQSVMDIHFAIPDGRGSAQMFHTEFLAAPTIDKEGLSVKLTLAGGEGQSFGPVEGPADFPGIDAPASKAVNPPTKKVKVTDLKTHLLEGLDFEEEDDEPAIEPDDDFLGEKFWENAHKKDLKASGDEPGPLDGYDEEDPQWQPKNQKSTVSSKEEVAPSDEVTEPEAVSDEEKQDGPAAPILPPQQQNENELSFSSNSAKTIKEMTQGPKEEDKSEPVDIVNLMEEKWRGSRSHVMGRANTMI
jgi:hypothetical protein